MSYFGYSCYIIWSFEMQRFEDFLNENRPKPLKINGLKFFTNLKTKNFKLVPDAKGCWAYLKHAHLGFLILNPTAHEWYLPYSSYTINGKTLAYHTLCSTLQANYDEVSAIYQSISLDFGLTYHFVDMPDTVDQIPGNILRCFTQQNGELDWDFTTNLHNVNNRIQRFLGTLEPR
jgi:hypothetical protein